MKRLLGLLIVITGLFGCKNDSYDKLYPATGGIDPCDTIGKLVSYSATVNGILTTNCAFSGCHDGATSSGGFNLSSYSGVYQAATTKNKLLGSIQHLSGFNAMPIGGNTLPACEIAKITKWVNQGSPNN